MLMGAQQAKQKQKAEQAGMIANAEQIRYSPWTGMNANIQGPSGANDPGAAALQGALGGAMQGMQINSAMAKPAPATPPADAAPKSYSSFNSPEEAMMSGQGNMMNTSQLDPKYKKPSLYGNGGMGNGMIG
ncbi:MAG: hypothetical protein ACK58T_20865 [Phycisphaerae bacterium]